MPGAPGRRPAGGGTDVGHGRERRVLPEVIGLPPGDLIKQVRFGPAMQGCCGQHCVLKLAVLPASEGALGQEPLAQPLHGQRVSTAGAAAVQRVLGEAEEHPPGKVLLRGCGSAGLVISSKMLRGGLGPIVGSGEV
jgi:hypothetical protein